MTRFVLRRPNMTPEYLRFGHLHGVGLKAVSALSERFLLDIRCDGKRWQQIASANPGLTPATLRAGATIVVP